MQATVISIDCIPEILIRPIALSYIVHGEIKLIMIRELYLFCVAFIVVEGAIQVTAREKTNQNASTVCEPCEIE